MGLVASTLATKSRLRVTATGPCTHVVEVRGFSRLWEECRGHELESPTFTVDGLDWIVWCKPYGKGDMGVYVELATKAAVAWARVKIGLIDWTTGRRAVTLCPRKGDADDPVLFDAGSDDGCNFGTGEIDSWEQKFRGSRYLRHDCIKIECVIDVCHSELAFPDPPKPRCTPRHVEIAGELGSFEGADVFIHVIDGDNAEPIPAHSSVLDAYAPCWRSKTGAVAAAAMDTNAATAMRVNVDDMPRPAVEALLRFVYTGTLPVVDGLSADGYRDMFWHLLLAGERYGMWRLSAICERVLRKSIDVKSAAAMLKMAHRHGFQEIEEACDELASDLENTTAPENTAALENTKAWYSRARDMLYSCAWRIINLSLVREVWAKYIYGENEQGSPSLRSL